MFDKRRPDDIELAAELAAIEDQLRRLAPAPLQVDRDRLMFAAGRAAERAGSEERGARNQSAATLRVAGSSRWFWPTATATMTAATVLLSAMLAWRSEQPDALLQKDTMPQAAAVRMADVQEAFASDRPESGAKAKQWPWVTQSGSGYLGVRNTAIARGVGAIESKIVYLNGGASLENGTPSQPATARELLYELLPQAAPARGTRS